MKHQQLINLYNNSFDNRQFDNFYDLLTADFHFENPMLHINGREEFIGYLRACEIFYSTQTIKLIETAESEYLHRYKLLIVSDDLKTIEKLDVTEIIKVENGLICMAILKYNLEQLSDATSVMLVKSMGDFETIKI